MRKVSMLGLVATVVALFGITSTAFGSPAAANVIKTGKCSAGASWKLKVKAEDGGLEAEFEVDQNRVGRRWRVVLSRNGSVAFRGIRRTTAPSGSFEVRKVFSNGGRITATAKSLSTGETCRASLSI
jgi:hypothetical protein